MGDQVGAPAHTAARVDIRTWPRTPSVAHVVLLDVAMTPMDDDVRRWIDEATTGRFEGASTDCPISAIRTGALFADAAAVFGDHGFRVIDRLALLERSLPLDERHPRPTLSSTDLSLRRLRSRDLSVAAEIDAASFPDGWQNDAGSLDEIRNATPNSLGRIVTSRRQAVAFALTGRAGSTGYLQRFAVGPTARRRGIGRLLVADALRWLSRRGATSALVNTGVDNTAARALYESCGFRARSEQLVVMEWRR